MMEYSSLSMRFCAMNTTDATEISYNSVAYAFLVDEEQ